MDIIIIIEMIAAVSFCSWVLVWKTGAVEVFAQNATLILMCLLLLIAAIWFFQKDDDDFNDGV